MIEKLPDVPFRQVWKQLSYEDRCILRRACKQLKSLVDRQVPQNLFLFLECYPCHQILFHSGEMVYYADSCRVTDFDRFISNRSTEMFRRIKKLTIFFEGLYSLYDYGKKIYMNWESLEEEEFFREAWHLEVDLEHLNAFEQVEHLEIGVRNRRIFNQVVNSFNVLFSSPTGNWQSHWTTPSEESESPFGGDQMAV